MIRKNNGKSVLVVDDEEINLNLLEAILSEEGANVDKARNGAEAFEMYRQNDYRMIFTDLMMPELDGMGLMRRINGYHNRVHAVLISATQVSENIWRPAGFVGFIKKPDIVKPVEEYARRYLLDVEQTRY
jgi:CheY-like chemotaxis protein